MKEKASTRVRKKKQEETNIDSPLFLYKSDSAHASSPPVLLQDAILAAETDFCACRSTVRHCMQYACGLLDYRLPDLCRPALSIMCM